MEDKKIPYDTSTPFFINGEGGSLYQAHAWPLNWGDFASTSGFSSKITSYTFRKHMSAVLVAEKRSLLVECEEYALCHSEGTRKKYYSDEQARMAKSLLGQEVYGKTVAGAEEAQGSTSKQSTISRRLKERHQVEMMKLDKKKVEQMVLADIDQAKEKKLVERSDGLPGCLAITRKWRCAMPFSNLAWEEILGGNSTSPKMATPSISSSQGSLC